MNKRLKYQFISAEKNVAITMLSPKYGIECICRNCSKLWRTAKHAVLVVNKCKLYQGCPWFPFKDFFPMPSRGKFKWVYYFVLIGPSDDSLEFCARTEDCRNHLLSPAPVFSSKKEAEKFKNEVLSSAEFKKNGVVISISQSCWPEKWPKYERGIYVITDL